MSKLESKSNLQSTAIGFDQMIDQFGVVTVMNAKVYGAPLTTLCGKTMSEINTLKAHEILPLIERNNREGQDYVFIDSLKIANITVEGPSKTVTGGQYANPLIKFGKTATIEMQDALGRANVLEVLGGAVVETYQSAGTDGNRKVVHITNDFVGPTTIVGDSFFIDQKTGSQVPVTILLYQMLPDAIFNLTQDAEGDATVFDLNGSLLATTITIGTDNNPEHDVQRGTFYSILPKVSAPTTGNYTITFANRSGADAVPTGIIDMISSTQSQETRSDGTYTIPVIAGLSFYAAATEGVALEGEQTVEANTTYYVGITE